MEVQEPKTGLIIRNGYKAKENSSSLEADVETLSNGQSTNQAALVCHASPSPQWMCMTEHSQATMYLASQRCL